MNDGRRRRGAKQARRDAKRARTRQLANGDDGSLIRLFGSALAKHPLFLLKQAAYVLAAATPDRYAYLRRKRTEPLHLETFVVDTAKQRCRETTAFLAVLAELMVDEDAMRDRCCEELARRDDHLPKWIVGLRHVQVYRAVRGTEELGDGDEIVIGARLADGTELTVTVYLDHDKRSSIQEVVVFGSPIAEAIADASTSGDQAMSYVDMTLADAREWIDQGLAKGDMMRSSNAGRESLPLVKWLLAQMPEGGVGYQGPDWDDDALSQLLTSFFADPAGAPFRDRDYHDLLLELIDSGSRDPVRWSAARIRWLLAYPLFSHRHPLEIALDSPTVLRAFVPFVHAQNGIRSEYTEDALKVIDDRSREFKQNLLKEAASIYGEDELGLPPAS